MSHSSTGSGGVIVGVDFRDPGVAPRTGLDRAGIGKTVADMFESSLVIKSSLLEELRPTEMYAELIDALVGAGDLGLQKVGRCPVMNG